MSRIGLLGGSFNPAHAGHRHISLMALGRLRLDELWWLVSPQNPLKEKQGMAPLAARLASARAAARHPRIRPMALESELGTQYSVDTAKTILARHGKHDFIWLMGTDNVAELHRWRDWRRFARLLPIAVMARGAYIDDAALAEAMGWLRRFQKPEARAKDWADWRPPAIVFLTIPLNPLSGTAIRAKHPDWADAYS